jgi:hypothetical protein
VGIFPTPGKDNEKEVLEKTKKALIRSQSKPPLLGEQQWRIYPTGRSVFDVGKKGQLL